MNGLAINSLRVTASFFVGLDREDLARGVSHGKADVPLLVEISLR
jgi:hypothetical protein